MFTCLTQKGPALFLLLSLVKRTELRSLHQTVKLITVIIGNEPTNFLNTYNEKEKKTIRVHPSIQTIKNVK